MKILHVIYSLRKGGAERIVVDLAKGLKSKMHTNIICTISPINVFKTELDNIGVNYHSLLEKPNFRFTLILPLIMYKLNLLIKKFNPDIIHSHLRNDSIVCSFITKTPVVRTIQNSMPFQSIHSKGSKISFSNKLLIKLEKLSILKNNFSIVSCNKFSFDLINSFLKKYNKSCLTIINNAIDLRNFEGIETNNYLKEKIIIISIGTLYKTKNQNMAIVAIKKLIDQGVNAELWLIGEGEDSKKLKDIANNLNVSNNIKFLGRVKKVQDYLKKATFYWSTSQTEGFSIANLEAMAMGVPIIATNVDGNKEMLKAFNKNCLVQYDDAEALAANTISFLKDRKFLKKLSDGIKKYTFKNYSMDKFVENYEKVYRNVLNK